MEVLFVNLSLNPVVPHAELEPLDNRSSAAPCSSLSQSSFVSTSLVLLAMCSRDSRSNECRLNTAKTVTPWTQSEYRYHPPPVQVKQKVLLALLAWPPERSGDCLN